MKKHLKSEIGFCRTFNFTSFVDSWLHFTSKLYILETFEHLPFYQKWRNMTSMKRQFLKNLLPDFYEILMEGVILILDKEPIVSRRYLPPFLSYQENPGATLP